VPLGPPSTDDDFYEDYYVQHSGPEWLWGVAELRNFDIDHDEVKYEHIVHFGRVAEALKKYTFGEQILLQGLASHTGSWEHNLELMKRRAVAVGVQLNHAGVPATRFANSSVYTMTKSDWSHHGGGVLRRGPSPDPGETGKKRAVRIIFEINGYGKPAKPPPWLHEKPATELADDWPVHDPYLW
jgi:hypothetical protein